MAPLGMRNVCTPAEALQTSQGRNRFAQSMRRLKLGTWNVRSMVDTEGSVEVASQWADGQRKRGAVCNTDHHLVVATMAVLLFIGAPIIPSRVEALLTLHWRDA